jgi:hypothetical protein
MTTEEQEALVAAQLVTLESMGTTAMLNLNAATTSAQQILSDINARVALGQMGAELVTVLTTAIQEAKQVYVDLQTSVADIQEQQEASGG